MIAVFMCYQDSVQALNVFAYDCQTARDFLRAQSCINQHTGFACNDQNRIAS